MLIRYFVVGLLIPLVSLAQAPHGSVVVQQASPPAVMKSDECITSSHAVIMSQPPFERVQNVMKEIQSSAEITTPPNKYRAYAKILVIFDSNGLIHDARIPLVMRGDGGKFERSVDGYASMGNRDVDKAILA